MLIAVTSGSQPPTSPVVAEEKEAACQLSSTGLHFVDAGLPLEPPRRRWTARKLVYLLLCSACVAGVVWLLHRTPVSSLWSPPSLLPSLQGNEKELVIDHLKKTLNDPDGMEIVKWAEPRFVLIRPPNENAVLDWINGIAHEAAYGEPSPAKPEPPYNPGIVMQARIRAKNAFGARVLGEQVFLIQNGKVVRSGRLGEDIPLNRYTYNAALYSAMSHLGEIVVERVDGRFTKCIVRGKVTYRGKLPGTKIEVFFRHHDEKESKRESEAFYAEYKNVGSTPPNVEHADTAKSQYELPGVAPGRYLVGLDAEGERRFFTVTVPDDKEVQEMNFDVK
jgi:hypothetical protein